MGEAVVGVDKEGTMLQGCTAFSTHVLMLCTGSASGRSPILVERLRPDLEFQQWDDGRMDESEATPDLCNTFKADKALGRKSDMFDYSGIVTMLCR